MSDSMARTVKTMQDSALKYDGSCLVPFSQGLPPFKTFADLDERAKSGVCRTIVTRWLIEQGKLSPKFWERMFLKDGALNSAFVGELITQFKSAGMLDVEPTGVEPASIQAMEATWLHPILQADFKPMYADKDWMSFPNVGELFSGLADGLGSNYGQNADHILFFILILKGETGLGHAIGFRWLSARYWDRPISFIDPNFGEFGFSTGKGFCNWIRSEMPKPYNYNKRLLWIFRRDDLLRE